MFCDTDSKLYLNLYLKHFKMKFCLFYVRGLCVGEWLYLLNYLTDPRFILKFTNQLKVGLYKELLFKKILN